jgi:hypothetical protein
MNRMLLKDKVAVFTGGAGVNGRDFATAELVSDMQASILK